MDLNGLNVTCWCWFLVLGSWFRVAVCAYGFVLVLGFVLRVLVFGSPVRFRIWR